MAEILNNREKRKILSRVFERFGIKKLDINFSMLKTGKHRLWFVSNDFSKLDFTGLRMESAGNYFAFIEDNEIRLSVEGSQLIGEFATKNILELNEEQFYDWTRGNNFLVEKTDCGPGFVLIKYKNDFCGCGKFTGKQILNMLPKSRRIKSL